MKQKGGYMVEQLDVKELFRKEIAKWKEEDPLFMAYVYGYEAGKKDGREKLLDEFESLIKENYMKYVENCEVKYCDGGLLEKIAEFRCADLIGMVDK
jgi:flagellar biosynthesis/type III secretory pathway protein FliH